MEDMYVWKFANQIDAVQLLWFNPSLQLGHDSSLLTLPHSPSGAKGKVETRELR